MIQLSIMMPAIAGAGVLTVVVALGALTYAGNRLFKFGLDPHATESMVSMLENGEVKTVDAVAPALDDDYDREASAWFEGAKRSVSLRAVDGAELLGWRVDNDHAGSAGHDYAIVCHGYSASPSDMAKYSYHFFQRGMNVLVPAARGHERNIDSGFIQMGWQDSEDLIGWIGEVVVADPDARIVLYGISMGGAEVMMASGRDLPSNVSLIIEDCGYSSVWDEFLYQFKQLFKMPAFPLINIADMICRLRAGYAIRKASATDQLVRATVPMLFIHGTTDTFVPFSMLDVVYSACASPMKRKLAIEGASHARAASTDPERYWSAIDSFIDDRF